MIIDKIQYCDYDYTLKQIKHGTTITLGFIKNNQIIK